MKILFAVNNDNVSEAIVKKYQKDYKEILSYKNVYYFNAIYRELQKDKSYSRIVISEDLEPFANNNYNSIDNFLLEKYNNISDEAKTPNNEPIDIILVCADRRKKTDDLLAKIYKKGIYNAKIGQDRSIDEKCKLINQPRDKEEAKRYYGIYESELGDTESETSVSEAEVENIRAHYARLGKNEDKYVDSFNNIVAQYTDTQLKIIIKYLPMHVKAVLEERSPKYQQLVMNSSSINDVDVKKKTASYKEQIRNKPDVEDDNEPDVIEQLIKPKKIKSVVIPSNITVNNVQKVVVPKINKPEISTENLINPIIMNESKKDDEILPEATETSSDTNIFEQPDTNIQEPQLEIQPQKKGRGRPRKNPLPDEQEQKPKRGRGRPKKNPVENQTIQESGQNNNNNNTKVNLFDMEEEINEPEQEVDLFNMEEEPEVDLFNMEADTTPVEPTPVQPQNNIPQMENLNKQTMQQTYQAPTIQQIPSQNNVENNNYIANTNSSPNSNFNTLLTGDKKIVAFVGTTKNGTSFIVNNTAEMLASMGIETAILDMTKTKNAYYIYTNNEESLRITAKNCMENLQKGMNEGIKVKKNLTVYTEMPGDEKPYQIETILATLLKQYSAILIDTDFDTSPEIFEKAQEIYLVQSMDVLTIQPLTAFLRDLKSKNILKPEKLKIVINKAEKVRSLSIKTLIGGMSCYNAPSMTYMTELFNKDNIRYCEIPFEVQNYVKYLDSLVNCSISLNGYTKQFMMALRELVNMVYPLVSRQAYSPTSEKRERRDLFSSQVNDTLNKMKSKY